MASAGFKRTTGVVYDHCLESHYSLWNKDYTERPERTKAAVNRCEELGLLSRCKRIPVREATLKEILTCHSQELFDLLSNTKSMNEEQLKEISQRYDYIYFHQSSLENARLALGATIDIVEDIVTEKITNGMAIIRPPGHHAMQDEFCGYCYFNNAAIAAQIMMEKHGLKRIIIFDWDVHHGQGSQFLFYHDPRVLYVSIHRYEYGEEWPFLRESDYDFIGKDTGKGYNINIPLNETKCGNDDFLSVFFNILLPVFSEFDPELVIVSAGFDCAIGCPEGEMTVTPACFPHFINLLTPLAFGKLALILEGGYNIKSLSESVALSLRALLGDPTPCIPAISKPKCSVVESVLNAIKVLHPFWQCLAFQDLLPLKSLLAYNHPFPGILRNPPVEGIEFYSGDNHPEQFPLIQECFGESGMHNMDSLNKTIDLLIQNTYLLSFQYRLSFSSDHQPSSNVIHSSLCQELKSLNLLNHCLTEIANSDSKPSIMHCIHGAIDTLMSRKAQSCIAMTCSGLGQLQSDAIEDCDNSTGLTMAVHYALNTHNIDRILVLRLASTQNNCLSGLEELKSVLQVNISWPDCMEKGKHGAGVQESPSNCNVKECGNIDDRSIDIEYHKGPLTFGDIVAAFHHIVLPVSYEFCPDLVIFSWDRQIHSSAGLPNGMLGHVIQYLHGLANGRLLLLADGFGLDADMAASDVDQLLECSRVLIGLKCEALGSAIPSKNGISSIRKTLDKIRDHWTTIAYQQQIPKLET